MSECAIRILLVVNGTDIYDSDMELMLYLFNFIIENWITKMRLLKNLLDTYYKIMDSSFAGVHNRFNEHSLHFQKGRSVNLVLEVICLEILNS